MHISPVTSGVNFKATIPVEYMVRGNDGQFRKVEDPKEAERCQIRVSKMLNSEPSDLKSEKAKKFVEFYKSWDRDYAKQSVVTSHVPLNQIWHTYLITGEDAVKMNNFSDEIGKSMRIRKFETGDMTDAEADKYLTDALNREKKTYCKRAESIVKNPHIKVRDNEGDPLCLIVYFDRVYGKKSGKLKDFRLYTARVMKSKIVADAEAKRAIQ